MRLAALEPQRPEWSGLVYCKIDDGAVSIGGTWGLQEGGASTYEAGRAEAVIFRRSSSSRQG